MTKTEIDQKIKIIETTEFKSIEECARYTIRGFEKCWKLIGLTFLSSSDIVLLALGATCFTMRTTMAT